MICSFNNLDGTDGTVSSPKSLIERFIWARFWVVNSKENEGTSLSKHLRGIVVPQIGVAAAAGLVLYFVAAMVTVLRARWHANCLFHSRGLHWPLAHSSSAGAPPKHPGAATRSNNCRWCITLLCGQQAKDAAIRRMDVLLLMLNRQCARGGLNEC